MRPHMVIDASGIVFLVIICLGVPYLAIKSSRQLGNGPLPMSPRRFFTQSIFAQLYLVAIAIAAAYRNWINLLATPPHPLRAWGLAALFLALLLGVMRWRWPHRDRESKVAANAEMLSGSKDPLMSLLYSLTRKALHLQ